MRPIVKSQRDFWSGILFTAIGVGFAGGATLYPFGASHRPGPGYFPLLLGLIMTGLGLMIVIESVLKKRADHGEPIGDMAWRPLLVIVACIALFGFLLPRVGLFITLPVLVVLSSFASDDARLPVTLLSAAVLTLGSWAVFVVGLGLTIPLWPDFTGN